LQTFFKFTKLCSLTQFRFKISDNLWIHDARGEYQKEIKVEEYKVNLIKINNLDLPADRKLFMIGLSAEGHPLFVVEYE
jgi:hypothetical protein